MLSEFIIVVLLIALGVQEYLNRRERKDLINRIIAKSLQDVKDLELAEKTKIKIAPESEPVPVPPELIPMEKVSDKKFFEGIKKVLKRE